MKIVASKGAVGLLGVSVLLGCQTTKPVSTSDIYVSVGAPRHWTLNDAQYLLAGLHLRTRDITVKQLANLDPNAFNSSAISQVESLAQVAVAYDQLAGVQNNQRLDQLETATANVETARAEVEQYKSQIATLYGQQMQAVSDEASKDATIQSLQAELAYINSEESRLTGLLGQIDEGEQPERKAQLENERATHLARKNVVVRDIAQTTADKTAITAMKSAQAQEITRLTGLLNTAQTAAASAGDVTLNQVSAPTITGIQNGSSTASQAFSSAITTALGNGDKGIGLIPSLQVSDLLSNHINAENELLARQLTLLRNEVGDNKNLLFLELPHSVESASKTSKNTKIRVEWDIASYCTGQPFDVSAADVSDQSVQLKLFEDDASNTRFLEELTATEKSAITDDLSRTRSLILKREEYKSDADYIKAACQGKEVTSIEGHESLAWDLIPRSNAYNTAEFDLESNEKSLAGVFSLLTGIGAEARYSRKEQLFQQFATQDVFASAYGQGERKFGWVMSPKPGQEMVSSGAKTTFATLIIPSSATVVKLKSRYCILREEDLIGSKEEVCVEQDEAPIKIGVEADEDFWVDGIDFGFAKPGEVATLIVDGSGFSGFQLDILVNGYPLTRYQGVGAEKREVTVSSDATNPTGFFQVVNSNTVVVNLGMPKTYVGTPELTFVTPGKSLTLNYVFLDIGAYGRGGVNTKLVYHRDTPMFQSPPTLTAIEAARSGSGYSLSVRGGGFYGNTRFLVNGEGLEKSRIQLISDKEVRFDVPNAEKWSVTAINELANNRSSASLDVTRPAPESTELQVSGVEVIGRSKIADGKARLNVLIKGANFADEELSVQDISGRAVVNATTVVTSEAAYVEIESDQLKIPLAVSQRGEKAFHLLDVAPNPQPPSN